MAEQDERFLTPESHISSDARIDDVLMSYQLGLLRQNILENELNEINAAPLFTYEILEHAKSIQAKSKSSSSISQYRLLAGDVKSLQEEESSKDPRILYNVAAPSSIFICGSQGSGKSHSLSCILESCLVESMTLGPLPRPLTGIVFHYDYYTSDTKVAPCEAAYLSSDPGVSVRVLCSPTNIRAVKRSYNELGNVKVEPLCFDQADLNTKRMLELMAFDKNAPLYAQAVQRVLREMRLEQQSKPGSFSYQKFLQMMDGQALRSDQMAMLRQRLDTLESFMVPNQVNPNLSGRKSRGTNWTPKAGELLIVDLSCPCITASMACALFNICLSIFLAQDTSSIGRIIALDEAHRYMGDTSDSEALTNSLLGAVRLQRHLGVRIVISTQEPTISSKLLDLCSVTIVHRFSSPNWLSVLTKHLAGISKVSKMTNRDTSSMGIDGDGDGDQESQDHGLSGIIVSPDDPILDLFAQIVELRTGEALVFAPSAILSLGRQSGSGKDATKIVPKKLAHHVLRVRMRARITADGGKSIMAS